MIDELDDYNNIDITLYQKMTGISRTTREEINPRVHLIKTEQIYHKYHTSSYANVIKVDKYIDNNLVNSYSWIQPITLNEIKEFKPHRKTIISEEKKAQNRKYYQRKKAGLVTPRPRLTEEEKQKRYEEKKQKARENYKIYYQKNKDKINARKKEYYQQHKEKMNSYSKQYYQDHIDELHQYNKEYYLKNK